MGEIKVITGNSKGTYMKPEIVLRRKRRLGLVICALVTSALVIVANLGGCEKEANGKLVITASTTMIEAIVSKVGGLRVEVKAIVPGGMCPGHFDISPGEMEMITRADALLYQGWETWVKELLRCKSDITSAKSVGIEGNWLIPDVHIKAVERIKQLLISMDPDGRTIYEANASSYVDSVRRVATEIKERFKPYAGSKVLCSKLQADFLTWLGFEVAGTFERQEDLTPRRLADLLAIGKQDRIDLIVDNLQSGRRVGEQIARELGVRHAVISNFPLKGSYLETLRENANELERKLTGSGKRILNRT